MIVQSQTVSYRCNYKCPCPVTLSLYKYIFLILLFFFFLHSQGLLSLNTEESASGGPSLSLDSGLEERLKSQIELMEKQKNEEIQNMKTSLIAEQQVRLASNFFRCIGLRLQSDLDFSR